MELTHQPELLFFLIIYFVLMIGIGLYYSRRIKNSEDFMLAGRGLGPIVLMGTLLATWVGSGTVTGGSTSIGYSYGLWPAILFGLSSLLGVSILYIIAPKIRASGKYTIAEALETKYGETAKIIASIIIILAFVGIVSYQYTGLGMVLNVTTGVSVDAGTAIAAVIVIFLATVGGLMSVAPTDALSAFIIVIGLIVAIPSALIQAGGWENVVTQVPETSLSALGELDFIGFLGYFLPTLFLLLGDQNMYQRLASSKGDSETKMGTIGWAVGLLVIYPAISLIAFSARVNFPDIDPGQALIATTTIMPTFIGGLMLASITAFIITTGSSYLLSSATNITMDIYRNYVNKNASSKEQLLLTRGLIVVLGILAYILIQYFPSILEAQMYAYTVYAAGITPAILGVYLWGNKVTKIGGIASMLSGVIVTLGIEFFDIVGYDPALISVPVAIIVLVVVSLMTQSSRRE
ncbi:sodium:solute symporter family protein [Natranaerobius thermophilus]|uniref:Na+/solute symporter n=1 Tax=Natranaerobius thermophilus (strain ATCC BAA-1301 / DSM 18059 / JW/NM-WN-LF) TaxID=457570 RepID=B2A2P6_NATTJ|nr:sodium:solute symporter family protein [Natranaerobius thermophilus]ACB86264.1 Na+/solute symporter [Natranaerobius thermophilus JW/NM-WN-LF]